MNTRINHLLRFFILTIAGLIGFAASASLAADLFDRLADTATSPYRINGKGFVTDASHPMHPEDFRTYPIQFRLTMNPWVGEAQIEIESGDSTGKEIDIYYFRRGRIFQVDTAKTEIPASSLGDVSIAALAALHPALTAWAMRERRENVCQDENGDTRFAWNDELWNVDIDTLTGHILSLTRQGYHDLFGDFTEKVAYSDSAVVVTMRGRETARLTFSPAVRVDSLHIPEGDLRRDRARVIGPNEITITEAAPHLFTIDIASMNTRVAIAEFTDYLFVIEGVYNSRNCDLIAQKIEERFHKPVKYFAFSHLHGQYLGGTRSWAAEGATIVVPPTTAPLINTLVSTSHTLRPDVLSRSPRPVKTEKVASKKKIKDKTNAIEIYNVVSEHTDEYFIFYFPNAKILLTGDLLFYRPGQPLKGRSRKLCETVHKLGLKVETYYCTWPLDGYGTKNIVSRTEMETACAAK